MMHSKINDLSNKALDLAAQVGSNLRGRVPGKALDWMQTGAALGAVRAGGRMAVKLVRRNPVMSVAAAAGVGLLWYAAKRRAEQARRGPIEGSATRIEARRTEEASEAAREHREHRSAPRGRGRSRRRSGAHHHVTHDESVND